MNSIFLLIYLFVLFLIPGIVLLIVFTTKARNRREFEEKYGYSPECYEQLKKIKELYECGMITAEDYEAKKKQILGL